MGNDPIVKLLFPVAEPAQMGLQMTFATVTLTDLFICFFLVRGILSFVAQQAQLNINHASVAEAAKIYHPIKIGLKGKLLCA